MQLGKGRDKSRVYKYCTEGNAITLRTVQYGNQVSNVASRTVCELGDNVTYSEFRQNSFFTLTHHHRDVLYGVAGRGRPLYRARSPKPTVQFFEHSNSFTADGAIHTKHRRPVLYCTVLYCLVLYCTARRDDDYLAHSSAHTVLEMWCVTLLNWRDTVVKNRLTYGIDIFLRSSRTCVSSSPNKSPPYISWTQCTRTYTHPHTPCPRRNQQISERNATVLRESVIGW